MDVKNLLLYATLASIPACSGQMPGELQDGFKSDSVQDSSLSDDSVLDYSALDAMVVEDSEIPNEPIINEFNIVGEPIVPKREAIEKKYCDSDSDCNYDELCLDDYCEQYFEVICQEPCPLSQDYIIARSEGINLSFRALYDFVGTTISKRGFPIKVHLTEDNVCREFSGTVGSDPEQFIICQYDVERSEFHGHPDLNDLDKARSYNILDVHEVAHLLWTDKVNFSYLFQEGFSKGVSAILDSDSPVQDFCWHHFEFQNPDSVLELSKNFWFRLCNEYGFNNDGIKVFFEELVEQSGRLERELTLNEVKLIIDRLSGKDSLEIFEEAGLL